MDPGEHTYVISYRVDGVLEPGTTARRRQFYWNLIPGGWQQPIEQRRAGRPPAARPEPVQCASAPGHRGCTARARAPARSRVTAGLSPHTPVTLRPARRSRPRPPATSSRGRRAGTPCSGRSMPVDRRRRAARAVDRRPRPVPGGRDARERAAVPAACTRRPTVSARPRRPTSSPRRSTSRRSSPRCCRPPSRAPRPRPRPTTAGRSPTSRPAGWAKLDPVTAGGAPARRSRAARSRVDERRRRRQEAEVRARGVRGRDQSLGPRERAACQPAGLGGLGGLLVLGGGILALASPARQPVRHEHDRAGPGPVRVARAPMLRPGAAHPAHGAGPRAVVAARRLPPGARRPRRARALRLLRAPGALHRLHPVGGRLRLCRRVGQEVPHRDRQRAARAGVLRRLRAAPTPATTSTRWSTTSPRRSTAPSRPTRPPSSSSSGGGGGFSGGGGGGGGGGGSW